MIAFHLPKWKCANNFQKKVKKSAGISDLTPKILQEFASDISPRLCPILNCCLEIAQFLSAWKTALVTPILKQGNDRVNPNSYRPISVLHKLSESLLAKRMHSFSSKNNIINKCQFGFRNKHSTFHALTHLTQTVFKALDDGHYTVGAFINLVRAFDTVPCTYSLIETNESISIPALHLQNLI